MTHLLLPTPQPLPLISRTEVHLRTPWLICAGSIQGPVKPGKASPDLNDDVFRIGAAGDVTWLIVADGVGTAKRAAIGAHHAAYYLDRYLYAAGAERAQSPDTLREAYDNVRLQLASHAAEDRAALSDYATTLLTVILTPDKLLIAKLGDGLIFTLQPHEDQAATYLRRAENPLQDHTPTITSNAWLSDFTTEVIPIIEESISAVVLCSDGAEHYFFNKSEPKLKILTQFTSIILNDPKGVRGANPILQAMLQRAIDSPSSNGEDDRTFIIATRNHSGRL